MKINFTPIVTKKISPVLTTAAVCCAVGTVVQAISEDNNAKTKDKLQKSLQMQAYLERRAQKYSEMQAIRETKIKQVIEEAIKNGEILSVNQIAEQTGLSYFQVYNIVGRNDSSLKILFNQMQSKISVSQKYINISAEIVKRAAKYKTTDGNTDKIINEDYKMFLAKYLEEANYDEVMLETFSECFSKFPAFMDILITRKNKNGQKRMIPGVKTLESLIKCYEQTPKITENLVYKEDEQGNYLYPIRDIPKMVEIYQISSEIPEFVNKNNINDILELLSMTYQNGSRFSINDIKKLMVCKEKFPELCSYLVDVTNSNHDYKYSSEEILKILSLNEQDEELTKKLIFSKIEFFANEPHDKYSKQCIIKICDVMKEGDSKKIAIVKSMIDEKPEYYAWGHVLHLPSDEILKAIKFYEKRKELMTKIDNDNLETDEFREYFHENFGKNGYKVIRNLAEIGFQPKEIRKILYFTGIMIQDNDIKKDWRKGLYSGPYSKFNIYDEFGRFIINNNQ